MCRGRSSRPVLFLYLNSILMCNVLNGFPASSSFVFFSPRKFFSFGIPKPLTCGYTYSCDCCCSHIFFVCVYNDKKKKGCRCESMQRSGRRNGPAWTSQTLSLSISANCCAVEENHGHLCLFLFGSKRVLSANTWCWTVVFVSVFSFLFFCCCFKYVFIIFFLLNERKKEKNSLSAS